MKTLNAIVYPFEIRNGKKVIKKYEVYCITQEDNITSFYVTSNSDLVFMIGFDQDAMGEDFVLEEYVNERFPEWLEEFECHSRKVEYAYEKFCGM